MMMIMIMIMMIIELLCYLFHMNSLVIITKQCHSDW